MDGWMAGKAKVDQTAELAALLCSHNFPANGFIGDAIRIGACLSISIQMVDVILHRVIKQR